MAKNERYWISKAVEGSQAAYAHLVETYQRPVFSIIVRMVRDPALAEDLTQETFIKAFRALESFDPRRKFSSWLFKIAHNCTIDHVRRKRVATVSLDGANREEGSGSALENTAVSRRASPEDDFTRGELATDLENALAGLRPEYAEILLLRFQQSLSYEEISEIADLPLGTVKTHLYRARKALAEALEKRGWNPGVGGVQRR